MKIDLHAWLSDDFVTSLNRQDQPSNAGVYFLCRSCVFTLFHGVTLSGVEVVLSLQSVFLVAKIQICLLCEQQVKIDLHAWLSDDFVTSLNSQDQPSDASTYFMCMICSRFLCSCCYIVRITCCPAFAECIPGCQPTFRFASSMGSK